MKNARPLWAKRLVLSASDCHYSTELNHEWTFITPSLPFQSLISHSLLLHFFISYSLFSFGLSPQPVPLGGTQGIELKEAKRPWNMWRR